MIVHNSLDETEAYVVRFLWVSRALQGPSHILRQQEILTHTRFVRVVRPNGQTSMTYDDGRLAGNNTDDR